MIPIGGVQKISLIDYPGRTSCVLFTVGCNMRCGYCHNPEMVLPERGAESISMDAVMTFLRSRVGKLEGVVISGGEPTMHQALPALIQQVKQLGYLVKLDTNGTNPAMLQLLLEAHLVDFVAMDIKAPLERYSQVAARPIDTQAIRESIQLILRAQNSDHEFRTTVVRSLLSFDDMRAIGQLVRGAHRFALQKFVPRNTLQPSFLDETTYSDDEFQQLQLNMQEYVRTCVVH